jgi:hypothetical protein
MINVTLDGGLGNQLFQYALGRRFAANGHDVTFDRTRVVDYDGAAHHKTRAQYGLDGFNTTVKFGSPIGPIFSDYNFPGALPFRPEVLNLPAPHTLRGHWQSEQYFANVGELRKELTLKVQPSSAVQSVAERIKAGNSVFLHVRHGDYLIKENVTYHGLMTPEYYTRALGFISARVTDIKPFIFSDDPEWCRQNLAGEVIAGNNQFEDLWLMSLCQHAVIANSTFSWWGAWLGDTQERIVVGPAQWFLTPHLDARDIIPTRWVKL